MIPAAHITSWRSQVRWRVDSQVEQDLVLSRALVEIFGQPGARELFAFRGGTAIHKLLLDSPLRYSEDIDLVQFKKAPIGDMIQTVRGALDPWLGEPKRNTSKERVILIYRFESTLKPVQSLRLKVEVNTVENFHLFGLNRRRLSIQNPWFSGRAEILVYSIEELLGTKLRALYQRKKGRDLFDLFACKKHVKDSPKRVVEAFLEYVHRMGLQISRAQFERNLAQKMEDVVFANDLQPLLPVGVLWDVQEAGGYVRDVLLPLLPGEPWKGRKASQIRA